MPGEVFAQAQELLLRREVSAAIECFDSAQRLGHDVRECAAGRWMCWMLLGRFENAWLESHLISGQRGGDSSQFWRGESWLGKRVMLRCLHGLGDTIQFIRYAPLLKETCRYLAMQTHPELVSLIRGVLGVDYVFTWGTGASADPVEWDVQLEVTELPRAFRTQVTDIPVHTPYIRVPPERVQWASTLLNDNGSLRIGVVWQAGPFDASRSVPLNQLERLFSRPGCEFYSLQKNSEPKPICDLGAHARDVQDTAALMLNLDLVITVDTMAAHLAGALGRPVWILLPARADWRWMLERTDSPWYPSAKLFRQERQGDWEPVISQVDCALGHLLKALKGGGYRTIVATPSGSHSAELI